MDCPCLDLGNLICSKALKANVRILHTTQLRLSVEAAIVWKTLPLFQIDCGETISSIGDQVTPSVALLISGHHQEGQAQLIGLFG